MTTRGETGAAAQRAAWTRLWLILLAPPPDEMAGRENGSAAVDETATADEEVRDDVPVTQNSSS